MLLVTLLLLLSARRSAGMPASKVPAISLVLPLLRGPSRDCRRSVLTVRHCSHGKYLSVVVGVVVPLFVVVPVSCSGGCGAPVCRCCDASVVVVVLSRGAPVRGGCGAPYCAGCGAPVAVVVVGVVVHLFVGVVVPLFVFVRVVVPLFVGVVVSLFVGVAVPLLWWLLWASKEIFQ